MKKYEALKQIFGHSSFRPGQEEIIDHILSGQDVLGIMPTGAGKSMCYQIPALVSRGITLVISPLISLMKDQVSALVQSGVRAAYLNSSLNPAQQAKVIQNILKGIYKIIYISPERLVMDSFLSIAQKIEISILAIDEAHCVSQWGQDFRASYLKIKEFVHRIPYRPVLCAFTATATGEVRDDIIKMLELQNPFITVTGFDRKNLYFEVRRPTDKKNTLLSILKEHPDACTIIYCSTRKEVEELQEMLVTLGYSATRYHAGLEDSERKQNQEDFIYDRCRIIVATNAFGMGIDKSNVTLVIHYNMPKNMESYYQEAGRAGRDGSESQCILLYSAKDIRTVRFFIDNPPENDELTPEMRAAVRERDLDRLRAMVTYCITGDCLREYILRYFGEKAPIYCGNCGNCMNSQKIDITVDAQKIISCIMRIKRRGRSCGKMLLADILRGTENEKIERLGLDTISTYGIMSDTTKKRILEIIDLLIMDGALQVNAEAFYTIETTPEAAHILKGERSLTLTVPEKKKKEKKRPETAEKSDLFMQLKKLRTHLAMDAGVPAYIIFSDAVLHEMAARKPVTDAEFLDISGVGNAKLKKYGNDFMDCIRKFNENETADQND